MRGLLGMLCVGALVVIQGCLPNFDKLDERACERDEDCPSQSCLDGICVLVGDDPDPEMNPAPEPEPEPAPREVQFAPQQTFDVGRGPVDVALGDVNGDGDLDIIAANRIDDNVSVLLSR